MAPQISLAFVTRILSDVQLTLEPQCAQEFKKNRWSHYNFYNFIQKISKTGKDTPV